MADIDAIDWRDEARSDTQQHLARDFVGLALKLADRDAMPFRVRTIAQHLL